LSLNKKRIQSYKAKYIIFFPLRESTVMLHKAGKFRFFV